VRMKASAIDPDIVALIDAAPRGADFVEEKLHELLLSQLPSQKEGT
jgi:hypothetical protein